MPHICRAIGEQVRTYLHRLTLTFNQDGRLRQPRSRPGSSGKSSFACNGYHSIRQTCRSWPNAGGQRRAVFAVTPPCLQSVCWTQSWGRLVKSRRPRPRPHPLYAPPPPPPGGRGGPDFESEQKLDAKTHAFHLNGTTPQWMECTPGG